MTVAPDDLKWLPESKMLDLCRLPRSVLNSWKRAGIDLADEAGAYGLKETISVLLLGAAREHIKPKEMAEAWREFVNSGAHDGVVQRARQIADCDRFDLIVDSRHAALLVAVSDSELIDAVCYPRWPRPVVVVDISEAIADVVGAFHRVGNSTTRPDERKAGRPRSAGRVHQLRLEGSR
jgi:hypothetical protein